MVVLFDGFGKSFPRLLSERLPSRYDLCGIIQPGAPIGSILAWCEDSLDEADFFVVMIGECSVECGRPDHVLSSIILRLLNCCLKYT